MLPNELGRCCAPQSRELTLSNITILMPYKTGVEVLWQGVIKRWALGLEEVPGGSHTFSTAMVLGHLLRNLLIRVSDL